MIHLLVHALRTGSAQFRTILTRLASDADPDAQYYAQHALALL
jgi:hypothetical protein